MHESVVWIIFVYSTYSKFYYQMCRNVLIQLRCNSFLHFFIVAFIPLCCSICAVVTVRFSFFLFVAIVSCLSCSLFPSLCRAFSRFRSVCDCQHFLFLLQRFAGFLSSLMLLLQSDTQFALWSNMRLYVIIPLCALLTITKQVRNTEASGQKEIFLKLQYNS